MATRTPLFAKKQPGGVLSIIDVEKYPGNIWFVNSGCTTGADSEGYGQGPDATFLTIDYAVGNCTANNGDLIVVMPSHTESITAAAGLALDIAGITIVFLGNGSNRGTIQFGTAVSADMNVDAANITLVNPRFVAAIDALTGPIDVNAAGFKIIDGEWFDAPAMGTTDCIVGDANATRLKIHGWKYYESTTGTQKQSNIQLNGVDDAELVNIDIRGDFATGNIENVTDEVLNIRLKNIIVDNLNASPTPGLVIDANATGVAENVKIRTASGTTYVSNVGKINWSADCEGFSTDGYSGEPIGTAVGSGVEGKLDTLQAEVSGAAGLTTFPAGVTAGNGVSLAEVIRYVQENIVNGGTVLPATQSIYDLIAGANGIATWAAAAAPGNNVSLSEAVRYIVETQLGTLVNAGGTETLGGILGDFANVTLAARLGLADGVTTESIQGKLGTDTELADRSLYDILNGGGPAAAAVAAAPANDKSLYAVASAIYNLSVPVAATGETVIDEGDYDWTNAYPALLTIAPAAGAALTDVVVHLDLAKAATGYAAVYAAQTLSVYVERKIDGTNWRREAIVEAALSGTLAAARDMKVNIGDIGITQQARITAVLSAEKDGTSESTIPYAVYYKGLAAPTITPLTATP